MLALIAQNEPNIPRANQLTEGLPRLNSSQRKAVMKALDEKFTLVWGPPGNFYSTSFAIWGQKK